ncbi:MAG TPA: hypothetical protein V6D08_03090 [Candidatus Obscuribacterales bacterium]
MGSSSLPKQGAGIPFPARAGAATFLRDKWLAPQEGGGTINGVPKKAAGAAPVPPPAEKERRASEGGESRRSISRCGVASDEAGGVAALRDDGALI